MPDAPRGTAAAGRAVDDAAPDRNRRVFRVGADPAKRPKIRPVMPGHSRLKDGVGSARLCPGHPRLAFLGSLKDVDGRDKPGHDDCWRVARPPPVVYFLPMTAAQPASQSMPTTTSAPDT